MRRRKLPAGRIAFAVFGAAIAVTPLGMAHGQGASASSGSRSADFAGSGLPVPRFVSLKSDRVNLRKGPGTEYPTIWVYRRAGLPVEVIREYEGWREVRDSEGVSGWVSQQLLSGRRTALIEPWSLKPGATPVHTTLRSSESETSGEVAKVEAGVISNVHACDGKWCEVSVESFKGFVPQKTLWGVYEAEKFK